MKKPLNISDARARLPELAKFLVQHPADVVLVEHRDLDDRIALITERHLRYLENMVEELKKQRTRPFRLVGSITSQLEDDEVDAALDALRAEAAGRNDRRLGDFTP